MAQSLRSRINATKEILHMEPIVVEAYSYKHKMSEWFTYGEMIKSARAIREGIINEPNEAQFNNLKALCKNVLDPIRNGLDNSVLVGSGLRVVKLNTLVGGSKKSQHRYGEAADFDVVGYNTTEVYEWVILESDIVYDQIIHEFGDDGWIHISFTSRYPNRMRNTVAMKVNGKTRYTHYTKQQISNGDYVHA